MYCVIRASAPSLYNVYRRYMLKVYDTKRKGSIIIMGWQISKNKCSKKLSSAFVVNDHNLFSHPSHCF